MSENKYFIIYFDSTLTQVEALEELAAISLKNNKNKEGILKEIKRITDSGMEGKIPITESLEKRIKLLQSNKRHIEKLIKVLKKKISPSFRRNREFFKKYSDKVYIISNGFKEFIVPVVKQLCILEKNIFANIFIFDKEGNITGFDKKSIISGENGKVEQLKQLNLQGEIYVIGDGYTDYLLKESGLITKFFAFTENVEREAIVKKADHVVSSFDELLYVNRLPMSISFPKNRIKVLLLENIHKDAVSILNKEG